MMVDLMGRQNPLSVWAHLLNVETRAILTALVQCGIERDTSGYLIRNAGEYARVLAAIDSERWPNESKAD